MEKGGIVRSRIDGIASGGEGMARYEGGRLFSAFTAPGDLCKIRITEEREGWARGELIELEEASPMRAEPVCPLYGAGPGRCGGCSLQHLKYEAQLAAKEAIVRDCFQRIAGDAAFPKTFCRIVPSPPLGYRNRIQFHCLPDDRSRVGFKQASGNEVVPVLNCPVACRGINEALKKGSVRPPPEKDRFTVYSKDDLLLSEGGRSRGKITLNGRSLVVDSGVFFQSNAFSLEALLGDIEKAAENADRSLPMVDIYCGAGTLAAFLSGGFPSVDLVEKNRAALAIARDNVPGTERRFFALSGDEWAAKNMTSPRPGKRFGFMTVDPPREGLSRLLRSRLAEDGPELLAYVSCDPATLARDSRELTAGVYCLSELRIYDFYPQTAHIECLAVFLRR